MRPPRGRTTLPGTTSSTSSLRAEQRFNPSTTRRITSACSSKAATLCSLNLGREVPPGWGNSWFQFVSVSVLFSVCVCPSVPPAWAGKYRQVGGQLVILYPCNNISLYLFLYFYLSIFVPLVPQPGQGSTARLGGQLVIILFHIWYTATHHLMGPIALVLMWP